jgi:aryl-alcohol dehydrogenase-like predicted oxidoreductase
LGVSKVECIYLHSVNPKHCDDSALSSLLELRSAGVTRRIGVSADNHDLEHYFQIGIFDQFMASFSVVDQLNYLTMKKIHEDNQLRLAIKRSLANGVWRKDLKARTLRLYRLMKHENEYFETGSYRNRYLEMSKELGTQLSGDDFMRFSFSLFQNATVLIGTNKLGHLKKVREVERSLGEDEEFTTKILNIFSATAGQNWNAMT